MRIIQYTFIILLCTSCSSGISKLSVTSKNVSTYKTYSKEDSITQHPADLSYSPLPQESNTIGAIDSLYDSILNNKKKNSEMRQFKVSILLPLSGKNESIGKSALNGIKMAILDSNINNVTILPIDMGNISDIHEVAKDIQFQEPDLIIGPVFSSEAELLLEAFDKINVPMITLSNNTELAKYKNVEVFGVSPVDKVETAINHAARLNRMNISIFLKSDVGAAEMQKAISKEVSKNKMALISTAFYDATNQVRLHSAVEMLAKNLSVKFNIDKEGRPYLLNIKKLKNQKIMQNNKQETRTLNVIITDAGGNTLGSMLSAMSDIGISERDILIISLSDNVDSNILNNGVHFVTYDRDKFAVFERLYESAYGRAPNIFGALGYDAMGTILSMIYEHGTITKTNLHSDSGFIGVSGEFKFGKNNIVERKYCIYDIVDGNMVKLSNDLR